MHLALAVETGERRFATGAYGFWRAHVRSLLVAAGLGSSPGAGSEGGADPDALVEVVLAPLAPEVYDHQRRSRGLSPEQVAAALRYSALRLLGGRAMA